ncbi:cytochrome C assembly family protein [Paraglaciecola aestuariivivens]
MIISSIASILYLLASGIIISGMFRQQGPNKRLATPLVVLALLVHIVILQNSIFNAPEMGQNMSMLNVASLVGWLISLTMFVASFSLPNMILLPVVFCFTGLIVFLNFMLPNAHVVYISWQPSLLIHITLALFAYACLAIAFLYALQLSYINLRLKEKSGSMLHSSLPPLLAVENILFKLLLVGTVLLTLSLISGFVFLDNMFAKEQAHKTVFSLLSWGMFTTILIGHFRFGWRGKPVVWATTIGVILLTLGYFGSRFVREVLLNA